MKKSCISINGNTLTVKLEKRLDTSNSMELINLLGKYSDVEDITRVVFDATDLDYIASTGIRAVVYADQVIGENPELYFVGAKQEVRNVFEITGIASFVKFVDSL